MSRVKLSLNGVWEFAPDPKDEFRPDSLPQKLRTIQVPGNWETDFSTDAGVFGRAWYRLRVQVAPDWHGRTVFLRFGAVNYFCQVWVNGAFVGDHEGGYTPFEFRVDPFLVAGEQAEIIVKVVHPAHATPSFPEFSYQEIAGTLKDMFGYSIGEIPLGKQNWYGSVSGIWQEVYLEAVFPSFLTGVLVTPEIHSSRVLVRVGLHDPPARAEGLALHYRVLNQQGEPAGERLRVPLSEALGRTPSPERPIQSPFVEIPIERMRLWGLEDPHLYTLEVSLEEAGQERDTLATRFGMRSVRISNNRICLNDEPLYIMGALDQDFYPESSYTPPSVEFLADQVDKAKHMGINLLRCHIKAPDPRYLDVADEKGILVWEELPNWLRLTEESAARGRATITRMIERDYNHPSTIIWTIINESWGADLIGKEYDRRWLKQMYHYVKRLDPGRLVVDNSPCNMPEGRNFHLRTDIEDFHIYFQIPDHYHKWNSWIQDFSRHPSWTFSHHGDAERTGEEPLLVSEFGNWGLPTLKDLIAEYGEEPSWFRTGVDITIPHGVQRRFNRLRLDDLFGSYDAFAVATQWQQYFALKHQIEGMRKHQTVAGYVITEFTDLHWEANGLLNIWRRPKVFYNYLAQFQQQDVILADWNRLNYWEGDMCMVRVLLSHWSRLDIHGYTVDWNISELGVSGTIEGVAAERAGSPEVGRVSFVVPPLTDPLRCRLHLRLRDREGRIVARNVQYLSFFPSSSRRPSAKLGPIWVHDPLQHWHLESRLTDAGYSVVGAGEETGPQPGLAVVSRIDAEVSKFMEEGGTVLFLAHSPGDIEAGISARSGIRVRDRRARIDEETKEKNPWEGDWVSNFSWAKHDPLLDGIPRPIESPLNGELLDMQYYRVLPNQVLLGWSPEREYEDIQAGMVVGWVHAPVTLIGQCRWGKGKLLATTFKLESGFGDDPVATILMHNLLRYSASAQFRPKKDALASRRAPRAEATAARAAAAAAREAGGGADG
ncbi:MAG TPA: glycoside hydrolase family 2 TIM barrel-domain containing protein [Armatimonadota bacterium]|nr:glycoside hydrolase family 2 TIM barrel-domain containing protein [Armatimonadota bacterium]